jgi:hypothetical protein
VDYSLNGTRRVLYRLPELLAADPEHVVHVVEGEKDADRLGTLGIVTTTCPQGAGKWRPEFNEPLRGRHVVILPDNDGAGRLHAEQVARQLAGVAASIRILDLPGLGPKGDASDWLDDGGTPETLRALVEATPEWTAPTDGQVGMPDAGTVGLPHISVTGRALRDLTEDALRALVDANDPPRCTCGRVSSHACAGMNEAAPSSKP